MVEVEVAGDAHLFWQDDVMMAPSKLRWESLSDQILDHRRTVRHHAVAYDVPLHRYFEDALWGWYTEDGHLGLYAYYGEMMGQIDPRWTPHTYAGAAGLVKSLDQLEVEARERAGFTIVTVPW